jgi:hypothetical protein
LRQEFSEEQRQRNAAARISAPPGPGGLRPEPKLGAISKPEHQLHMRFIQGSSGVAFNACRQTLN